MSIKERSLSEYLKNRNPYPCLNVLESAFVCYNIRSNRTVPDELLEDLKLLFGENTVETEITNLVNLNYLEFRDHCIALKSRMSARVSGQLNQIKKNLPLNLHGNELTAGAFLDKLVSFLRDEVDGLEVMDSNGTDFI